ncbi:ATP-binding protein [Microlunatus sp. Gsoil 973]|uniref:ATP-binding protein n=1 Tax=Microlunatus sp. Gsoil 973 TaxID=2672569 RepID=UPI0012B4ACA8|nr:AAA family ATPase [Microlunatus sp. Gsoil 973]QGN34967.1 AAA family ATPase [Microlunatus sp. Gsoil 973]
MSSDPDGLRYLLDLAGLIEDRVRALIRLRRAGDPNPDDPFRGLYVSDELVDRLLQPPQHLAQVPPEPPARPREQDPEQPPEQVLRADIEAAADRAAAAGGMIRLRQLARDGGLDALDVELMIIAMLPDLDSRFERLYGYLNDDVTRRRATVGLALQLAGRSAWSAADRSRLDGGAPLSAQRLIMIEDVDRPFLTRSLRVPDRVVAHLLGDDRSDPLLEPVLDEVRPYRAPTAERLARALRAGSRLVHIRERSARGTGAAVAASALAETGRGAVVIDATRLAGRADPATVVPVAVREALLRRAGLVITAIEQLAGTAPETVRGLVGCPIPVIMVGSASWEPQWTVEPPLPLEAPALNGRDRLAIWRREFGTDQTDLDLSRLAAHLNLGPDQIAGAVRAAESSARLTGGPITAADLRRGARTQNAAGLERLARRIDPEVGWDDLVLTPAAFRALRDLAARARHRDTVLTEWRMRRGGGRGHGVIALFAGDSGTGKTMSAEVIAADLGLDLYTVNLATVVDKYVGETEKNLERIFVEAAGVNAVLFFDEADAIFGKRSDVRDAHDRYANIESAYLLQRLETFDGLAVLATNLRANIDDAFTRRLDAIIDFAAPNAELRKQLWRHCLSAPLPVDDGLDLDFLAEAFELAGGNIRSAATTAAYLAAAAGSPVTMAQVISAVEQEYRKLGRLVLEREFGPYLAMVR